MGDLQKGQEPAQDWQAYKATALRQRRWIDGVGFHGACEVMGVRVCVCVCVCHTYVQEIGRAAADQHFRPI
eukprot:14813121-Alexandrium_andersonii.AAC.1